MTRFLVLLAIALAMAIAMVVKDIRRMRRERDARRFIGKRSYGQFHVSDGHYSFEILSHIQGHTHGNHDPRSA